MHQTELNFDRMIDLPDLEPAIAGAMNGRAISIWHPGDDRAEHDFIVTTENPGGEFPLLVRMTDMHASEPLSVSQVRQIARQLRCIILTDSIDTGIAPLYDDGYTMVGPDGDIEVLRADESGLEIGQLNLAPESRQRYRLAASRLSPVAAD
jgi:hypothetical protein